MLKHQGKERGKEMANQDHVQQLKQGAEEWNKWRKEHSEVRPDLHGADLSHIDLHGVDLHGVNLYKAYYAALHSGANLHGADLRDADLHRTDLYKANLSGADLRDADLHEAHLIRACLSGANLSRANLSGTNLHEADLREANLSGANLSGANLHEADLREALLHRAILHEANVQEANLHEAILNQTVMTKVDLRLTKGLTTIQHDGPSHIDVLSIQLPQDGSALHFLRGIGAPDEWIHFWQATRMHPIQYQSCFISYCSKDEVLAKRIHADLQAEGVRCWFAPEDLKIGERIRQRIDEAIHIHEKLLLLLSEHALASDWVEKEAETAFEKERKQKREVLFPIRLDDSVMQAEQAWAADLRRTRHIGDFTNWTNLEAYQSAFERLLRDLKKADERRDQETKQ